MNQRPSIFYTSVILLITIIWGSTFFIIKDTVTSVNEYFIVFGRTFVSAIVMFFVLIWKDKSLFFRKAIIIQGTILGVLLAVSYISQTIGLKFTSSGHSAFITSSAIVLVPILLLILYKQNINTISLLSFFIVFSGLFLLTYDLNTKINKGDSITLITAISLAFHIIFSNRFVQKSDVYGLVFYQFLAASVVSLAGFIINNDFQINLSYKSTFSILYLGFIGTLFCYFASVWVLKYVHVLKVTIIFSLEPVFAALFAYLAVNELLSLKEWGGAILILCGIMVYQMQRKFKKQRE